jgi:hypothetical protein
MKHLTSMAEEKRDKERVVKISDGELHNTSVFTHGQFRGTEYFFRSSYSLMC